MREPMSTNKIRKIQQRLLSLDWFSARAFLIFVLAGLGGLASIGFSSSIPDAFAVSAAGQKGKKPPPPPPPTNFPGPSNLRMTGLTSSTVALAWDPSPDSRSFIYVVRLVGDRRNPLHPLFGL